MDFGFEHGSDAPLQGSLSLKRGHRPESGELWAFAMIHDSWFPISRFALLCPQAVVRSCRHGKRNKLGRFAIQDFFLPCHIFRVNTY